MAALALACALTWLATADSARDAPRLVLQLGHGAEIAAVAFSPDGRTLASASFDHTVKLWDTESGDLKCTLERHRDAVTCVAFSPDGRTLASGSDDGTAALWDVGMGRLKSLLIGHEGPVTSVVFRPGTNTVMTSALDRTVRVWDARTGTQIKKVGMGSGVQALALSPEGDTVATVGTDNGKGVGLWSASTFQLKRRLPKELSTSASAVLFAPDGLTVATEHSARNVVRLWDVNTGELKRRFIGQGRVRGMAFDPSGKMLAVGNLDNSVSLYDVSTGKLTRVLRNDASLVLSIAFSPDGAMLASGNMGDTNNTITIWDVASWRMRYTLQGRRPYEWFVAFSADGSTFATGSRDFVRLWDTHNGRPVHTLVDERMCIDFDTAAISSDCRAVASADHDARVRAWNTMTSRLVGSFRHDRTRPTAVAISHDGAKVATGGKDTMIRLWDVETGRVERTLVGHGSEVTALAFSRQSDIIASRSRDDTVRLWDASSGRLLRTFSAPGSPLLIGWSVALSPHGRFLAASRGTGEVTVWNLRQPRAGRTLTDHVPWTAVTGIVFSPRGETLATAGADQTIQLWSVRDGRLRRTLPGHANCVCSLAYGPDGRILASGGSDGTVKLWETATGDLVATLLPVLQSGDSDDVSSWQVFTPAGFYDGPASARAFIKWRVGDKMFSAIRYERRFLRPGLLGEIVHDAGHR